MRTDVDNFARLGRRLFLRWRIVIVSILDLSLDSIRLLALLQTFNKKWRWRVREHTEGFACDDEPTFVWLLPPKKARISTPPGAAAFFDFEFIVVVD